MKLAVIRRRAAAFSFWLGRDGEPVLIAALILVGILSAAFWP